MSTPCSIGGRANIPSFPGSFRASGATFHYVHHRDVESHDRKTNEERGDDDKAHTSVNFAGPRASITRAWLIISKRGDTQTPAYYRTAVDCCIITTELLYNVAGARAKSRGFGIRYFAARCDSAVLVFVYYYFCFVAYFKSRKCTLRVSSDRQISRARTYRAVNDRFISTEPRRLHQVVNGLHVGAPVSFR